jgi:hypothetical protein
MEPHAAAIVEDWALRDLIERLYAVQELLLDTAMVEDTEELMKAAFKAESALEDAADYLRGVREERLRARVSA